LDQFYKQLERTSVNLHKTGNWRLIQKTTAQHDLHIIDGGAPLESSTHASTIIFLLFLLGIVLISAITMIIKLKSRLGKLESDKEANNDKFVRFMADEM
jgi:hypothetical protein